MDSVTCFIQKQWATGKYDIDEVNAISYFHSEKINLALVFINKIGNEAITAVADQFEVSETFLHLYYLAVEDNSFSSAYLNAASNHIYRNDIPLDYNTDILINYSYFINKQEERVIMPNGNDGLICSGSCRQFFPYVLPNGINGSYTCRTCRGK